MPVLQSAECGDQLEHAIRLANLISEAVSKMETDYDINDNLLSDNLNDLISLLNMLLYRLFQ